MAARATSQRIRDAVIWLGLAAAIGLPAFVAALSPLLAWREPIYIVAGFAGVTAMSLVLVQALLIAGVLPGLRGYRGRRVHRVTGAVLLASVIAHVAGLWLTSPPDVVDALLFRSPTLFSPFGVIAMWALFATATLAAFRKKMRFRLHLWRLGHSALAVVIATGGVVHAMLIEGTMGLATKAVLCLLVLLALGWVLVERQRREGPR